MFGMTIYETFAGCAPFMREQMIDPMAVGLSICKGERPAPLSARDCPPRVMDLVERCWAHDPHARPPMLDVENCLKQALHDEERV